MRARFVGILSVPLLLACPQEPQRPEKRMEVKKTGAASIQVVPAAGQHPYCLVYTIAENGTIRQLTMGRYNESWKCEPGKPIGNRSFRVPLDEGKIRVLGIFSDQRLSAGPVSDQLFEKVHALKNNGVEKLQIMDMRLPGKVTTEWGEFVPEEESAVVVGAEIGKGGEVIPDAGPPGPGEAKDAGATGAPVDAGTEPAGGTSR